MIRIDDYITTHYNQDGDLKFIDDDLADKIDGVLMTPHMRSFVFQLLPKLYRIYYDTEAQRELLYFYLQPIMIAIEKEQNKWNNIRKAKMQKQNWNSSKLRLEQMLRDTFEHPNIYITSVFSELSYKYLFNDDETVSSANQVTLFNENEGEDDVIFYNESEFVGVGIRGTIQIDSSLIPQEQQIRAFLDFYTFEQHSYEIEWI